MLTSLLLTPLLLSVLTLHVTMTSGVQLKEKLTFVMMAKTTGFHTRRYTNTLRNKARELNRDTSMAWHSHYQLHTQYALHSFAFFQLKFFCRCVVSNKCFGADNEIHPSRGDMSYMSKWQRLRSSSRVF